MPKALQKQTLPRQRPVSCRSCRTRKLKCSRTSPCSNCVSRGLQCDLKESVVHPSDSPSASESDIAERLQRLENLLAAHNTNQPEDVVQVSTVQDTIDSASQTEQTHHPPTSTSVQGVDNDVARLESIYRDSGLAVKIPSNKAIFRICPLQQAIHRPQCVNPDQVSSAWDLMPTRCFWLPEHAEATALLQEFLYESLYLPQVLHTPSLSGFVEEMYHDLIQQSQINSGGVILLFSIFAWTMHMRASRHHVNGLLSASTEAKEQALFWINAAQDIIHIANRFTNISLEGVQGIIITTFIMANIEGKSRRTRLLYSTALSLARELGLHRIDHPANTKPVNTVEAETGRRTWWYLCASDWLVASRLEGIAEGVYTCHVRQMITRKPLNINDEDIFDGMILTERPLSQYTSMSYPLQRLKLGEVARSIVDRRPLSMAHYETSDLEIITDLDTELQTVLNDMPAFFSMSQDQIVQAYGFSSTQAVNIFGQGQTLKFLLFAQRCKLHLPYLTKSFTDITYSSCRTICIQSARQVIKSEAMLRSVPDISRFRYGGLIMGVFMASIVLLMDLCLNKSSPCYEKRCEEVAEAFRILEEAKSESDVTAKFVELWMQIMRKHRVQPLRSFATDTPAQSKLANQGVQQTCIGDLTGSSPCAFVTGEASKVFDRNANGDLMFDSEDLSSYFNELAQGWATGDDIGNFDWDPLFTDLGSSLN